MVKIFDKDEIFKVLETKTAIMSFCPKDDEPDIWDINKWILQTKGFLICPKIEGQTLKACKIHLLADLKKDIWDIWQPSWCEEFELDKIQLILVPGTKFDKLGNRKGRGKWFYDKFLPKLKKALKIGVAFELQQDLKPNKRDVPMDWILLRWKK